MALPAACIKSTPPDTSLATVAPPDPSFHCSLSLSLSHCALSHCALSHCSLSLRSLPLSLSLSLAHSLLHSPFRISSPEGSSLEADDLHCSLHSRPGGMCHHAKDNLTETLEKDPSRQFFSLRCPLSTFRDPKRFTLPKSDSGLPLLNLWPDLLPSYKEILPQVSAQWFGCLSCRELGADAGDSDSVPTVQNQKCLPTPSEALCQKGHLWTAQRPKTNVNLTSGSSGTTGQGTYFPQDRMATFLGSRKGLDPDVRDADRASTCSTCEMGADAQSS